MHRIVELACMRTAFIPTFFHPWDFEGEDPEILGYPPLDFVEAATVEGEAFGGVWEMDGVDPVEVGVHESAEEHGVAIFGNDVFARNKIGQHRNCFTLMQMNLVGRGVFHRIFGNKGEGVGVGEV